MNRLRDNYFVYKRGPFRPLYLGGYFNVPHKRSRLWLMHDRDVARKLAALNNAEYADFRDYVRLATGGKPFTSSPVGRKGAGANRRPPTLDELA